MEDNHYTELEKGLERVISPDMIGDKIDEATMPYKELMAYYKCAMMEVETKFNIISTPIECRYIGRVNQRSSSCVCGHVCEGR